MEAKSGLTFTVNNPFDGTEVPAKIHSAGEEDINLAVKYAQAAFKGEWGSFTGAQRAVPMLKFADLLEKHAMELATIDATTMGGSVADHGGFLIPQAAATFRCKNTSYSNANCS